jgi:hypothetical protein
MQFSVLIVRRRSRGLPAAAKPDGLGDQAKVIVREMVALEPGQAEGDMDRKTRPARPRRTRWCRQSPSG